MRLLGIKSLWLVLGLMACTDKSGQDTGSGSDSGAAGNTVYTVQEGDWTLAPATIALDECELGSDLASGDEESLTITASGR